jgi:hypothetical protein
VARIVLVAGLVVGLVAGVGVQFVPVKGVGVNPSERYQVDAPPEVQAILRKACMDCHSNETRWPWYSRIAPGSWLMIRDVRKGRSRFNMSEWGELDEEDRVVDKENAVDMIDTNEMPPWFYLPLHLDAILSDEEKATLKGWLAAR